MSPAGFTVEIAVLIWTYMKWHSKKRNDKKMEKQKIKISKGGNKKEWE